MRKSLLFSLVLLVSTINAQITVSSSSLVSVGDTLFTGVDNNPININLGSAGGDQSWDFSSFDPAFYNMTEFIDVPDNDMSDAFPNANMFVATGVDGGVYYRKDDGVIYEEGRTLLDPLTNEVPISFGNNGESIFRTTPLEYQDVNETNFSYEIKFSGDLIPDTLLAGVPITPDSVRVTVENTRLSEVDAWGSLVLPDGTYQVLRERNRVTTETIIEIKTFLGWLELDPALLGGLAEVFEPTSVGSYRFYADGVKEILAEITIDEDGIATRAVIKAKDVSASAIVLKSDESKVFVHPNPSYGNVNFEFVNLKRGYYRVHVSNILGKSLYNQKFWIDQNARINEDLSFLSKGTYIYTITNESGERIATKRLVIMTP